MVEEFDELKTVSGLGCGVGTGDVVHLFKLRGFLHTLGLCMHSCDKVSSLGV